MQQLRAFCTFVLLFGAAVAAAQRQPDAAATYPNRPVRWVVPFAPGGSTTLTARLFADKYAEAWGQQFIIDNRGGAGGIIGADTVAKAVPDGYTLLFANPGPSVGSPLLNKATPYKFSDFAPVILFGTAPLILIAHPSFSPNNPKELLAHLKANPGKVNWGSSGAGGITHIGLLLFQTATRTNVTHVPYKGNGPAFIDLVGAHIQLLYATTLSADSLIKSRRVKVIGVANVKRLQTLPDVPTLAESGIGESEVAGWFGLSAPANTPRAIITKLNAESNRILQMPEARHRLDELGLEIHGGPPADFDNFLQREIAQVRKLINQGALKPE